MFNKIKTILKIPAIVSMLLGVVITPVYAEDLETVENTENTENVESVENTENTTESETPSIQLQLSPGNEKIDFSPGDVIEKKLTVGNVGSQEIKYKAYSAPYSIINAEGGVDFDSENKYTQISSWTKIKDENGEYHSTVVFAIKPGETQTLEYKITIPENAPDGSQHETIFVESIDNGNSDPEGIKAISRVGLVIFAKNQDGVTDMRTTMQDFSFKKFLLDGNISGKSYIKNEGNVDADAYLKLTIKNLSGELVFEDSRPAYIFPESERAFDLEWEETPWVGIFNVTLESRASGGADQVETAVVLKLPIFLIVIQVLLLVFLCICVIILVKKRKQRQKASQRATSLYAKNQAGRMGRRARSPVAKIKSKLTKSKMTNAKSTSEHSRSTPTISISSSSGPKTPRPTPKTSTSSSKSQTPYLSPKPKTPQSSRSIKNLNPNPNSRTKSLQKKK